MARKEIEIKIEEGRDAGKTFKITEMGAVPAYKWLLKAFGILGKSGVDFNYIREKNVTEFIAEFAQYEGSEPLLDELLACAGFIKDGVSVQMKGAMVESVIEDWTTIFRLQMESFSLMIGFLDQGGESTSE